MILAWLKGPIGKANYMHSEGACCATNKDKNGKLIHDECVLDKDYVMRKAFEETKGIDSYDYHEPPEWCKYCGGRYVECVFCHTAEELILENTRSQKELALNEIIRQCKSDTFVAQFINFVSV